ncbi:MAG: MBL fold metallo-hydrolase [Candidatus Altarchaeaceae archaeon]
MEIYPIISYGYDSNCYIIFDEKICIIDTGFTKEIREKISEILNKIKNIKDREIFIINTHCHYDHIGNDGKISEKFNAKIFISEYDRDTIIEKDENKVLNYLFGKKFPKIDKVEFVKDNAIINLGETKLRIIHTPGHTHGSISIYENKSKILFTGDLIFADSIGRNDLVDSNVELQKKSIEKILKIDFENLYSGHGRIGKFEDALKVYKMFFE